ncbi:MAG: radical SAM family heme chaperone HemW [Bifidobacteriaceae bacterium]|nr:radical SAM family heme chaperone HemW [Bifidobacteriaceae bacterium]MCI1914149.1 radical SAM family heme chaperone HemW [Bifidobacteriaceae bacterium]
MKGEPVTNDRSNDTNDTNDTSSFRPVASANAGSIMRARQLELGRAVAQDSRERSHPRPFEVYFHVPFCLRRCGYCDFNTYTATDLGEGASRGNFANLAVQDAIKLRRWQDDAGIPTVPASTVFFGGGTPTILPAKDLIKMLDTVRSVWGLEPGAEVTTEANPDTVDDRYIATLAEAGFTRISFGMQSAVPQVLRTLDRTHSQANVVAGVAAAEKYGLRSSVDLIYGAPGESVDQWCTSVEAALDLGVNHISAYALTLEPTTKMGRLVSSGRLASPDDDDEATKYEMVDSLLSTAGFEWYEISNWARNGEVSRHNLGYWRNAEWAGIGPGAHSHYGDMRAWDTKHPRMWAKQLHSGYIPWSGTERVNAVESVEETVMLGLRLHEGLSLRKVSEQRRKAQNEDAVASSDLGTQIAALRGLVGELSSEGLVEVVDAESLRIRPTLHGRLLNDLVIERVLDAMGN